MRQLSILVGPGQGTRVFQIAQQYDARNLYMSSVQGTEGTLERVNIVIQNQNVGNLLDHLEKEIPKAEVSLKPNATLSLKLPSRTTIWLSINTPSSSM